MFLVEMSAKNDKFGYLNPIVGKFLYRNKQSFEFTVTRIFMKVFHSGSSNVVKECQFNLNFLPVKTQINMRTARFLQKFIASENSLCLLFAANAACQLNQICISDLAN